MKVRHKDPMIYLDYGHGRGWLNISYHTSTSVRVCATYILNVTSRYLSNPNRHEWLASPQTLVRREM